MTSVPNKVASRITSGLKRFKPVLDDAYKRDVNESDTVTIVTDILSEVMGYDKYTEITSEFSIRGTACDLAVKLDGKLAMLIEVKAIGLDLKDNHIKQAVDYASNEGCEWVCLTNGVTWQIYNVIFSKPIQHELVINIDLLALSNKSENDLECIYLLSREGWQKSRLDDYVIQKQALSRFSIAAVVLSEPTLNVIRRELRRMTPEAKIDVDEIQKVLSLEVLKREVIEGEQAEAAQKRAARASKRLLRSADKQEQQQDP